MRVGRSRQFIRRDRRIVDAVGNPKRSDHVQAPCRQMPHHKLGNSLIRLELTHEAPRSRMRQTKFRQPPQARQRPRRCG